MQRNFPVKIKKERRKRKKLNKRLKFNGKLRRKDSKIQPIECKCTKCTKRRKISKLIIQHDHTTTVETWREGPGHFRDDFYLGMQLVSYDDAVIELRVEQLLNFVTNTDPLNSFEFLHSVTR